VISPSARSFITSAPGPALVRSNLKSLRSEMPLSQFKYLMTQGPSKKSRFCRVAFGAATCGGNLLRNLNACRTVDGELSVLNDFVFCHLDAWLGDFAFAGLQ
jgi:hypothetical protein